MMYLKILKKLTVVVLAAASIAILNGMWVFYAARTTRVQSGGLLLRVTKPLQGPYEIQKKTLRDVNAPALTANMDEPRRLANFILDPINKIEALKRQDEVRWTAVNMVKSAIGNKDRRNAIRETWGSLTHYNDTLISTVFILGNPMNETIQKCVYEEFQKFGDILQIDAKDEYKHISYKTLAGMQWAGKIMPEHWIYSSADDDIALHVPNFVRYIDSMVSQHVRNYQPAKKVIEYLPIMCIYSYNAKDPPARDPSSKWYMPKETYAPPFWPPYCRGGWYTTPVSNVRRLYDVSRFSPFLHLDDVWITGLMRSKLLALRAEVPESALWNAMIEPAPLSRRTDGELKEHSGEDTGEVIVSHVWGNIKEENVNVSLSLQNIWKKWSSSIFGAT